MSAIEIRRKLSCPKCRGFHWHDSVVEVIRETNTCRNCNWVWKVSYDTPSKLYDQLMEVQVERVEDAISSALSTLSGHSWSVNQGTRDKDALQKVRRELEYGLAVLKTFSGE